MLKNQTLAILAAIILIASIAIVSAGASANDTSSPEGKPMCPFSGMGMHRGMMALDKETMEARMEEHMATIREKLELPENASVEEIREAMKENMESLREERLNKIKEKLGLPEDATEEEVKTALQEWREENKDLIIGLGGQGPGMHRGFGMRGMKGFR